MGVPVQKKSTRKGGYPALLRTAWYTFLYKQLSCLALRLRFGQKISIFSKISNIIKIFMQVMKAPTLKSRLNMYLLGRVGWLLRTFELGQRKSVVPVSRPMSVYMIFLSNLFFGKYSSCLFFPENLVLELLRLLLLSIKMFNQFYCLRHYFVIFPKYE